MNFLMIGLRTIHIFSAVAWVGGNFLLVLVISRGMRALGPEAGKFMGSMTGPGRMTQYLTITGVLTALSGLWMYWLVSGHLDHGWLTSGPGAVLTVGAVAGILAWLHGAFALGPIARRMGELSRQMGESGGPPAPEHLEEMHLLRERQATNSVVSVIILSVALIGMSVAQYAWF